MSVEEICKNCVHWDTKNQVSVTHTKNGVERTEKFAPCKVEGVIADMCGESVVLLGGSGTCQGDYFEADADLEIYDNGVIAGIDFPATLGMLNNLCNIR